MASISNIDTLNVMEHQEDEEIDINTSLILLVKDHPFLYDLEDKRHKDRDIIERTWITIAAQINMSVEDAKTKWQRLRNSFCKAMERRMCVPRTGSAATKLQKPWVYEADMDFLRSYVRRRHRLPPTSILKRKSATYDVGLTDYSHLPQCQSGQSADIQMPADLVSDNDDNDSNSMGSANFNESFHQCPTVSSQSKKMKKQDLANEMDSNSAVLSFIRENAAQKQEEVLAIGWFKSLLPMFNTLGPTEKLAFQAQVTLELRKHLSKKPEEQHIPTTSLSPTQREEKEDANLLFFKSMVPSMKNLNDIQKMELQGELHSVVLKHLRGGHAFPPEPPRQYEALPGPMKGLIE